MRHAARLKRYRCGNEERHLGWMTRCIFLHSVPPPADKQNGAQKNGQRPATKALSPELAEANQ